MGDLWSTTDIVTQAERQKLCALQQELGAILHTGVTPLNALLEIGPAEWKKAETDGIFDQLAKSRQALAQSRHISIARLLEFRKQENMADFVVPSMLPSSEAADARIAQNRAGDEGEPKPVTGRAASAPSI